MNRAQRRALVIIPTFREAENIVEVLHRVRHEAPAVDVLVVDDKSTDATAALAEAAACELGRIEVLRRDQRGGLGAAYRAGFALGLERGYEVLVEMDADLSHDPAALPALLREAEHGADLAIGSRYVPGGSTPGWPRRRRMLSRFGNAYAVFMLGLHASDVTSGYRAYRAPALAAADYEHTGATGYGFQIELAQRIARSGGKIVEVPISFVDRVRGESKMSGRIIVEALALVAWWAVRDRILHRRRREDVHRALAPSRLSGSPAG
jgi:dolichol-phosphate mannosyltransferase